MNFDNDGDIDIDALARKIVERLDQKVETYLELAVERYLEQKVDAYLEQRLIDQPTRRTGARGSAPRRAKKAQPNPNSASTVPDYFHAFVDSLVGRTVVTERYGDGRSRTEFVDKRTLRDPVARKATKDRVFVVTAKYFNEWCRQQRVTPSQLRADLLGLGYIRQPLDDEPRHRLFKGTSVAGGQVQCIEFNFDMVDKASWRWCRIPHQERRTVPPAQAKHAVTPAND